MLKLDLNTSNDDKTTKKKQKLVKHKRKNWSKTDISDVERGIDELRKEQLTGYLFFIYFLNLIYESKFIKLKWSRCGKKRLRAVLH
jgi:hypothetical protein